MIFAAYAERIEAIWGFSKCDVIIETRKSRDLERLYEAFSNALWALFRETMLGVSGAAAIVIAFRGPSWKKYRHANLFLVSSFDAFAKRT
jgi:hypothetical protein